jgi:voltage-gated potassium channel
MGDRNPSIKFLILEAFLSRTQASSHRPFIRAGNRSRPGGRQWLSHAVLGMHPSVPVVIEELELAGDPVVVIADVEPSTVPDHAHFIRGNPTDDSVLRRGRPEEAAHIPIAADDDGDVLITAVLVRQEAPHVPVTALVGSQRLIPVLRDLGIVQVLSPDDLTGHTIAKGLEAPHAGELLMHLVRGEEYRLVEHVVPPDAAVRPLNALRREQAGVVFGMVREAGVSLGVSEDPDVGPGDLLFVVEPNGTHRRHTKPGTPPPLGAMSYGSRNAP